MGKIWSVFCEYATEHLPCFTKTQTQHTSPACHDLTWRISAPSVLSVIWQDPIPIWQRLVAWGEKTSSRGCQCSWNIFAGQSMMTSSNGNIFHITGPLWGESTGHWCIPLTKASDAELWCIFWSSPEQMVEQTIKMPVIWDVIFMLSLWCHCNAFCFGIFRHDDIMEWETFCIAGHLWGEPLIIKAFSSQRDIHAEILCLFSVSAMPEQPVQQILVLNKILILAYYCIWDKTYINPLNRFNAFLW